MVIYEKVREKVIALENEAIAYATKLISFPSVSGREMDAQKYVKKVLQEDLEFDFIDFWEPDIEEMKNHEAFITKRDSFAGSPNVVGILKGSGSGKSLILNSHIDIVPEGDHCEWTYPPFKGVVENGIIYGPGVSDMKGTKAAMFIVLKAFKELGIKLKGDIVFQSVIEEESGSAGTLACALKGYKADAAIIPEPSGFKICPAQQGSTWFRVNITGKSAHGGKRYLGVSAIDKAYLIISAIQELEKYRNKKFANPLYEGNPIPFTINIGTINGGVWPSSVPEKVSIEGRMGVAPGESLKEAWKMFEDCIVEATKKDPWLKDHKPTVEWFGAFWGSSQIDNEHPIVEVTKETYKEVMGENPVIEGTPWATDARILTEFADTPALIFGPGTSAHCPDEFMEVKSLMNYAQILAIIILKWCDFELE